MCGSVGVCAGVQECVRECAGVRDDVVSAYDLFKVERSIGAQRWGRGRGRAKVGARELD